MALLSRQQCPICARSAPIILNLSYGDPRFSDLMNQSPALGLVREKDYEIRKCSDCDLLFQTWVITDEEAKLIYTTERPDDNPAPIGKQSLHAIAHNAEEILVIRQVFSKKIPKVLDFGSGWGRFSSMAQAYGCEVLGHELNTGCAEYCSSRGIKMISREEISNHCFDFINADQVLEHLADPRETLMLLVGSLADGGLIKISVPGSPSLRKIIANSHGNPDFVIRRDCLKPLFPLVHVNLFSPRSMRSLAASVGVKIYRPPFFVWLGAGQLWNIPRQFNRNLVVPFKRFFQRGTYLWMQKP